MNKISQKIEQIGEKFDERFKGCFIVVDDEFDRGVRFADVKSFLNTALLELLATVGEEVEGAEVEGAEGSAAQFNYEKDYYVGYNQALSDIKQALQVKDK